MDIKEVPQNIGFVGAGNMAQAIIGGLLDAGYPPERLCASDPSPAALAQLRAVGIEAVAEIPSSAFNAADLIILAVKPQFMASATALLRERLDPNCVVMSVAAGISTHSLKTLLGHPALPVVRCMPNTPALVRAGASGLFASPEVSETQRRGAEAVMRVVGSARWLATESHIDVVTAVSGSGPAYFFAFMEAMIAAGERLGLDAVTARELTLQTALGAATLAAKSDESVATLRKNVTSPGGTTERALTSFEESNLSALVDRGMQACLDRAREMAEEFG